MTENAMKCPKCGTIKEAVTLLTDGKSEQEKFGRYKIIGRICKMCDYIEMYDKPKKRTYLNPKTLEKYRKIAGICMKVGSGKCLTEVDPFKDVCTSWSGDKHKHRMCNTCTNMHEGLKD